MTKPSLILCTLGRSLATGSDAQKKLFKQPDEWFTDNAETRQLIDELKRKAAHFKRDATDDNGVLTLDNEDVLIPSKSGKGADKW